MPTIKVEIDDKQLDDDLITEALSELPSAAEVPKLMRAMGHLMSSGDVGFWLSPRLMRKLKGFASEQPGEASEEMGEVNDLLFLEWLKQVGAMEPSLKWEVERLPSNGGIYRMLLERGHDEEGTDNHPSQ